MQNSKKLWGWTRLFLAVTGASIITLLFAWLFAPVLATFLAKYIVNNTQVEMLNALLIIDLALSAIFFFLGSLLAIKLAKSRPYLAAFGVSMIGWAVYYAEVGGINGMLYSEYPMWYEFFPSHFGTGWLAASIVSINRLSHPSS
jgi:hypothetical protein